MVNLMANPSGLEMVGDATEKVALALSDKKQLAVLGHWVLDQRFAAAGRGQVRADSFGDPWVQKSFKLLEQFVAEYRRSPSAEEALDLPAFAALSPAEVENIRGTFRASYDMSRIFGVDVLKAELDSWIKGAVLRRIIEPASVLYSEGQIEKSFKVFTEGSRMFARAGFNHTDKVSFGSPVAFMTERKAKIAGGSTSGLRLLDQALLSEGNGNSLIPGDTTLFLAPVNVGKTTTMVTLLRHNLAQGRRVLFITHEGNKSDLEYKIWRSCLRKTDQEMSELTAEDEDTEPVRRWAKRLRSHCTFLPMHAPSLNVAEVCAAIERENEICKQEYGKPYALVVDDYLGVLKSGGVSREMRHELEEVYTYASRHASEYDYHLASAIQANRAASTVNKGRGELRNLTVEDVAETFGATKPITNLVTINRPPWAASRGWVGFHVAKSRSGRVGQTVVTQSRFDQCYSHGDEKDGSSVSCWYNGAISLLSGEHAHLFEEYAGRQIPDNVVESIEREMAARQEKKARNR